MIENKIAKKRFTMRVTAEQLKELRIIAALHDMTMTEFVDRAIRKEIEELKKRK